MTAVVATALAVERAALRGQLGDVRLVRVGLRARRGPAGAVLVAGVGVGLAPHVRSGDVVVATEVLDGKRRTPAPSAPLLAAALRRLGLTVHLGPVASSSTALDGQARAELARTGALAVDTDSGPLAARGGPLGVVRVVVDTADVPLGSPGTAARRLAALGVLRASAPALREWALAVEPAREVVLAGPRSFCAGVERAIDIVERALERYGAPVYVRRQIVHNAHVVAQLQARGAVFVQEVAQVPRGAVTVLAAHGVSPTVRVQAQARDLLVVDATCPLVAKVHSEVKRYAARGDTVFLIGHGEHEEVEGTVGEAPGSVLVVPDLRTAATVRPVDPARVAYVMQTTLAVDEAEDVAGLLRRRFPGLAAPRRDDICYATTNRQAAVRAVAHACDVVLVVGSANSSNSRRLVEVAEREGTPAYLVEDAGEVDLRWLAGARRVGVTAGASAPPQLVDRLVAALAGLGPLDVREERVTEEDIRFTLPKEVS